MKMKKLSLSDTIINKKILSGLVVPDHILKTHGPELACVTLTLCVTSLQSTTVKEQKAFEKNIFNKTHWTDSEIALLEGLTVVYKSSIDLYFYVIGSSYENELMLLAVLNCLFDSLNQMLRKNVEKRALLENMEGLFLAVDEIVDGGVILESDPQQWYTGWH
ncbi:Coatomer subunit zeta-1 [Tupaia chinensis]|uniref:Coatomer subunit zeta n=1 Tax=Tupaia chinensis TaxID=246437 RepID=L9JVM1_TUPCH|nr:Coatomer subunit zeta-1 [Tupaia chinensis]